MKIDSKLRKHFKRIDLNMASPFCESKDPVVMYNKGGNLYLRPNKDGVAFRFGMEWQDAQFKQVVTPKEMLNKGRAPLVAARSRIERSMVRYENKIYTKINMNGYRGYWTTTNKGPEMTMRTEGDKLTLYAWYRLAVFVVKA